MLEYDDREWSQEEVDRANRRSRAKRIAVCIVAGTILLVASVIFMTRFVIRPAVDAHRRARFASVERPMQRHCVAVGANHVIALQPDGTVLAAGDNSNGQCEVDDWTDIISVAAGSNYTLGLRADGTVLGAGCDAADWEGIVSVAAGGFGSMGLRRDGTVTPAWDLNYLRGWRRMVAIDVGEAHVVGLREDGTVDAAALGYLQGWLPATDDWKAKLYVLDWQDIVAVAAGQNHTVGLKADGTVVTAGDTRHGQDRAESWKGIVSVVAGGDTTLGLTADGTVLSTNLRLDPGWTDIVDIDMEGDHVVGLKKDGSLVIAGAEERRQLRLSRWSGIISISAGEGRALGVRANGNPITLIPGGCTYAPSLLPLRSVFALHAGAYAGHPYTVALRSDGTSYLFCGKDFPDQPYVDLQSTVRRWWDIKAVASGDYFLLGLDAKGTVVAAGSDTSEACGLAGQTGVVAIAAGCYHSLALKADGTVVAAGPDYMDACEVADWADIVAISAEDSRSVGLKRDGTVVATGRYAADFDPWRDIVAISSGERHTVGLKSDGAVVATGDNKRGQCDVGGWQDIVAISAGDDITLGLKSDGTVVTTGRLDRMWYDIDDWAGIGLPLE